MAGHVTISTKDLRRIENRCGREGILICIERATSMADACERRKDRVGEIEAGILQMLLDELRGLLPDPD